MRITDPSQLSDLGRQKLSKALEGQGLGNSSSKVLETAQGANSKKFKAFSVDVSVEIYSANYWLKKHWAVRKKQNDLIFNYLGYMGVMDFKPEKVKRHVIFTRYMKPKQRAFDADNLRLGFKGALDCLKRHGVIYDDTQEFVSVEYRQEKSDIAYFRIEIK